MRIIITGALGHIGSRLIREMPRVFPGAELVLLNRYSSQRYFPLFDLPEDGNYRFIGADVLTENLSTIFKDASSVIHLASTTRTVDDHPLGEDVEKLNLAATGRVAAVCCHESIPLVFLSTTSVYGTNNSQVDETCLVSELKPQNSYAQTKLREEALLQKLGHHDGLKFVICRLGTIFGFSPGMRFDTAVNKFCWQATLGLPVTIWKTAMNQLRPYLDVADAVRSLMFIVEKKIYDNRIYNILTLNTSVSQILTFIRREIPDLHVKMVEESRMNDLSYEVANRRFRDLGFEFTGDLPTSIHDVLKKLRAIRHQPDRAQRDLRRTG